MKQVERNTSVIDQVCAMPQNQFARAEAEKHGLSIVNVMWEDTARTPGSCWGANITDMTLQVKHPERGERTSLLPVLRHPNFRDITGDVPLDKIRLKVGNESGKNLKAVTLRKYLENIKKYLSDPSTRGKGSAASLVTEKDTHALVSAQACILPIPSGEGGKVEFNPVLYNYQSRADSPAVLAIMISPEGTSATVLDNSSDKAEWGQNVYFNNKGQKTCLTGQRVGAWKEDEAAKIAKEQGISADEAMRQVKVADDMNMVIVIQVPLKHKPLQYRGGGYFMLESVSFSDKCYTCGAGVDYLCDSADVEDAVIGHGEDKGKHLECGNHKIERDTQFPIRVTVQFYKASDSANVSAENIAQMAQAIKKVYEDADYIGSLVDGSLQKGELGMGEARPTQPAPQKDSVMGPPTDHPSVVNPFDGLKMPAVL